ncbi:DUF5686 family protein [Pedobacter cryophilus]|uniref:Carboxypeptidase-like regulatory domain-containing protein n=1 Tax=Pedobacter cryophilus TaxID=2571271 RepID=A0A4U1BVD8_9SPHI|nr:DUF5686 family protein [Pedobacter cryophilus]TKB96315.1 hypothetical protein FA046_14110 [Pedobacter cryophilus]
MKKYFPFLVLYLLPIGIKAQSFTDSVKWVNQFIRETIAVQKDHAQIGFENSGYLKNSLILDEKPEKFLGKNVEKYSKLVDHQLIWLFESYGTVYYTPKDGYKESIKATRSFGKYPSWEFKSAVEMMTNFAKDVVRFGALSDKSFVSPLANNAFNFYTYEVIAIKENLVSVKVKSKKLYTPTFEGILEIDSLSKQVMKLDLRTTGNKGINFIDSLRIKQYFKTGQFSPAATQFLYKGKLLKFSFSGSVEVDFKKWLPLNQMPNHFEKMEVIKEDSAAYHAELLESNRTIPLTLQERMSLAFQDTLRKRQQYKDFTDSIDGIVHKAPFFPLLFSDLVWKSKNQKRAIIFDPILPAFFYNTVEGAGINYGFALIAYARKGKYWSVIPKIRYGLANNELNSDISFSWLYDPKKRGLINFSAGSTYADLNPNGTLNSLQNTLNTLLFEQNFMKLYRKEYGSLSIGKEITKGLYFSGGAELSRNYSVQNNFDYSFRNIKERNFSSNNPLDPNTQTQLFPNNTSFHINASLIYTVNQPFIMQNGMKTYKLPLGPRFILDYRKGFAGVFNSNSDYHFMELSVQQEKLNMGLWGYGSYSVSAGKFFNVKNVYYPEWRHFVGNMALVFNPGLKSFHLLNFYTYSTNQYFLEGHFEHNFNMRFSNHLPILRKLKLEELFGGAYLYQPQKKQYYELYAGLRRLMFRVDYAFSFDIEGQLDHGIKLSYNF